MVWERVSGRWAGAGVAFTSAFTGRGEGLRAAGFEAGFFACGLGLGLEAMGSFG